MNALAVLCLVLCVPALVGLVGYVCGIGLVRFTAWLADRQRGVTR